jgi:hypothetical protein
VALPTDVDSTWVNPASKALDAGELRRADAAMFAGDGSAIGARGGIVRHGDSSLAVTVDASDVVTVQPGAVVIPGNAIDGTGCYRSALPAAVTGSLSARDATNARIDLIVFRQLDTDVVGTHGAYTARVDKITGTPSATPSAPALPSMAVELARVTVPASGGGAASVDSSYRTFASAIGGRIVVSTATRLPASAATGQLAVALDTLTEYEWDGSSWVGGWKSFTPSVASGWTLTSARYYKRGPEVTLEIKVNRSGATITANSSGEIVNTAVLNSGSIPAAIRPAGTLGLRFTRGGFMAGTMTIGTDGSVTVTDAYPTANVASTGDCVIHDSYVLG